MKKLSTLAAAVAAAAGLTLAASAHADLIDARFSGTVATQNNTSFATGAAISGEFVYDTATSRYLSFSVGGQSVAPGYGSSASVTPDLYSAIYQAQVSPVPQGGTLNSTFALDLEGTNPWTTNNPWALLTNPSQLAANLDTTASTFRFYTANADGTGVRSVSAALSTIQVAAVPEPASVALLLVGIAAIGLRGARRQKG